MNNHSFEVMGLDKNFNLVSLLRFTNLQWRRKFYEAGSFSIEIPLEQYSSDLKYVYTKDRPEVGEISQVNYIDNNGSKTFALSGYFLEEQLNRRIAYLKSTTNISNAPTWVNQAGAAEDVATAYFNAFKSVQFTKDNKSYVCDLGITAAASQSRGKNSDHMRENEYLGDKIYKILKPSEMSFCIEYDFTDNTRTFKCIKGVDRTSQNAELNNPVVFSTRYGNIKNPNIVWSDTKYKNAYISTNSYEEDNVKISYAEAGSEALPGEPICFLQVSSNVNHSDYSSTDDYINALFNDGHTKLLENTRTISFDFDAIPGSYEYMNDFDLGDKCSLEIKEVGMSEDAILSECTEVIKKGNWSLTLGFDV